MDIQEQPAAAATTLFEKVQMTITPSYALNNSCLQASAAVNPYEDISDLVEPETLSFSDELTAYLGEERERVSDVLEWWKKKQVIFPRLSRMAMDYHCVPGEFRAFLSYVYCSQTLATSVDVERAFSQGRILLSHTRNRLSAESTRSLLCLGAWFKGGLVRTRDIMEASKLPELKEGITQDDDD